jgi:hypothetical protein
MIQLSHHDARYIALHGAYQHKDAIKALADYPDVQWHKESGAWLVDNRLWPEIAEMLGPWLASASVSFWMDFTVYEPPAKQQRRTKQQIMAQKAKDKQAAGRVGRAVVEMMHKEA